MTRAFILFAAIILCGAGTAAAQTGAEPKRHSEGEHVAPKIDMPASRVGVSVHAGRARPLNPGEYATRLRRRGAAARRAARPAVVSVGPRTTYLKEGLDVGEVFRLLGQPSEVSERQEGGRRIVAYAFQRGAGRILRAEFVDGVLVRSRVEADGGFARASAAH